MGPAALRSTAQCPILVNAVIETSLQTGRTRFAKSNQSRHLPRPNFSCHLPFTLSAGATPASGTSSIVSCTVAIARIPATAAASAPHACVAVGSSRINAFDVFFCSSEYVLSPGVFSTAAVGEACNVSLGTSAHVSNLCRDGDLRGRVLRVEQLNQLRRKLQELVALPSGGVDEQNAGGGVLARHVPFQAVFAGKSAGW